MSKSLFILFFFIGLLLMGCKSENKTTKNEIPRKIKIIDLIEANNLHATIAEKNGYFLEEGLDIDLSYESAGLYAMNKLVTDESDYAVVVEMNVVSRVFVKDDIIILAELSEPIKAIKIIGRKDHGINSAEDLKGKKIGLLQGVNIHKFMLMYLKENNISVDDVEIINMKPPQAYKAFLKGEIDATILWQPMIYKLENILKEKMIVLTDDDKKYWPYDMVLVTKKSTLSTYPDEAKKILRALIKADSFIKQNEKGAQLILAEILEMQSEDIEQFWDEVEFNIELSDTLEVKMAKELIWFQELGLKKNKPIDDSFDDNISDILLSIERE